ncbi:MAG: hypothetical protein IPJ34_07195 [Myxococcales bacterium]|nr:hypothetical protein [Myxococcales bacterium]
MSSLSVVFVMIGASFLVALVVAPFVAARRLRKQHARGTTLAARIGIPRAGRRTDDFRAEGVVQGVPMVLTLDAYQEPNSSSSTDRVRLSTEGVERWGLVTIAERGLPAEYELHSHPKLGPRTVATLPGAPPVAWLRPEVVEAIAALPSCARVESYDQTLAVLFLDGPELPPVDLAVRVLLRVVRGAEYQG